MDRKVANYMADQAYSWRQEEEGEVRNLAHLRQEEEEEEEEEEAWEQALGSGYVDGWSSQFQADREFRGVRRNDKRKRRHGE